MINSVAAAPVALPMSSVPLRGHDNAAAAVVATPEADGRLLDALLFAFILVAWAAVLCCWLSHFPTSLV